MKETIGAVILFVFIILGVSWLALGNDFFLFKVFAPRFEQVRRETFEQSKAYRQGMIQELQSMRFQYEQASPEHKAALASLILHRTADFPADALPPDLRSFLNTLQQEQVVAR